MNRLCRIALAAILASLPATATPAQQSPKPAVPGPSLDVTLKFIQDQLLQQGPVHFAILSHDSKANSDLATQYTIEFKGFTYDSAKCSFDDDFSISADGGPAHEFKGNWPLSWITSVKVMAAGSWWGQEMADEGTPARGVRVQPPYFALSKIIVATQHLCVDDEQKYIQCAAPTVYDRFSSTWSFSDEDTAKRVAQALVHAVALCGGGSKDPF